MKQFIVFALCVASAFAGNLGYGGYHGEYHADIPAAIPATVIKPAVKIAHQPYTVAHHGAVLQKQIHHGSVPRTEIVNEPYTITQQGPPVQGYAFQSEVRHDSPARYAAPLVHAAPLAAPIPVGPAVAHHAYAAPVAHHAYAAPLAHAAPVVHAAPLAHAAPLTSYGGSTNFLTGPAVAVHQAAPLVRGYSVETGRTELHSQTHYEPASIPTTVYKNVAVPGSVSRLVHTAHVEPVVHHSKTIVAAPVVHHAAPLVHAAPAYAGWK